MPDILYTIFIYPIEQIISLSFLFIFRASNNPALSILGVSFTVSILTLPLYLLAEKHQRFERNVQKKMKPQIDNIKSAFSGDERFLRLAACYRQNHYHPIHSLRLSISLIIQIPFFIAAYYFLSNLDVIKGASFGPINDLSKPDFLIKLNSISINILPIVMTLTNLASTIIYSKSFPAKEKIQLYCTAGLFMFLLYNSPSAMVLYWTGNNVFSLVKNIIQKSKLYKAVASENFQRHARLTKKELAPALDFVLPKKFKKNIQVYRITTRNHETLNPGIFLLSLLILFLLVGVVIPSFLISSSVQEFSFQEFSYIESYKNPLWFILTTILQSAGACVFWPLCVYLLTCKTIKLKLEKLAVILTVAAMVNAFLFPGQYGFLTLMFQFSENPISNTTSAILNLSVIIAACITALTLSVSRGKIILFLLILAFCTNLTVGIINCKKISSEFQAMQLQLAKNNRASAGAAYQFSKTGRNVLLIVLDRGINGFTPYIFEEKPELYDSFDGFVWYKNTVSLGGNTIFGSPGIFGGYEYGPYEMQSRKNIPMVEKHNESLLLLPKIFLDNGFKVNVTDPPFANYSFIPDLSIFSDYPQIHAENIEGKYTRKWLARNQVAVVDTEKMIESYLIPFSFFRIMPLLFRNFIYDNGEWLTIKNARGEAGNKAGGYNYIVLDRYIALDVLPGITSVEKSKIDTYNVLQNAIIHDPWYLQAPDYIPSNEITNTGTGPFASDPHYHTNMAALLLLGKWFDFLKENDVYDNTRIIIVSDHGWPRDLRFPDSIKVPNGENLEAYAALLLVKDFNSSGSLSVDNTFMTNADVPLIALNDIVENPVNPWTGNVLSNDKGNGVDIITSWAVILDKHLTHWNIGATEWLHVHGNIFDPANWSSVVK